MGWGFQPPAFLISVSVHLWIGKMNVNQQFLGFPTIFRYKKAHRWSQPSSCSKGLFERPACFQHVLTHSSQEWLKESHQTWVYSVNSKIKDPTVVNYSTCAVHLKYLSLSTHYLKHKHQELQHFVASYSVPSYIKQLVVGVFLGCCLSLADCQWNSYCNYVTSEVNRNKMSATYVMPPPKKNTVTRYHM